MIENTCLSCNHDIPLHEDITLNNCKQCSFVTDAFNQAYETRNLVAEEVEKEEGKFNSIMI